MAKQSKSIEPVWLWCDACEKLLQDTDTKLPDTAITDDADYHRDYFSKPKHFCDKACQVRYILTIDIKKLENKIDRLLDVVRKIDPNTYLDD